MQRYVGSDVKTWGSVLRFRQGFSCKLQVKTILHIAVLIGLISDAPTSC